MNIKKNITLKNCKSVNKNRSIDYIVIHYTAGKKDYPGAAKANTDYFKSTYRGASAHYFVDMSDTVWQCVEDNDISWHAGDKPIMSRGSGFASKCRNDNSLSIEMVSYYEDGVYKISEKTADNAARLCAYLCDKYKLGVDRVITHFDITGKLCPMPWISDNYIKNNYWTEFIRSVEHYMTEVFNDIKDHWAKKYIIKLYDYGIVSGDGDGRFRPDDTITRAEVSKMISDALLILGK